jgi:MFS transporter, FHS family, L-fucose permease
MSESTSSKGDSALVFKGMGVAFALLVVPFALWGAANNMTDMLVPAFQKVMSMSQTQSSLIQFSFYGAYFCMALPAAFLIKKFSYKTGVVSGLFVYAAGAALCYPASQGIDFNFFLFAFYVFAAGCATLETCVAPYVISMGPDESATQRINLAQSFNPVGSICGLLIGKFVILRGLNPATEAERAVMETEKLAAIQGQELGNVVNAYMLVGLVSLLLGVVILVKKFPKGGEVEDDHNPEHSFVPTFKRLIKNKNYVMSVIAQFFYVGCQIGVWTYTIAYLKTNNKEGLDRAVEAALALGEKATVEDIASNYMIYGLILFTASRFLCTFLMKFIDPARLLTIIAGLAAVLCTIVIWGGGAFGGYALVAISGCMSLCFPTIYGLGLTGLDDNDRKLGGSGIIMSIVGGAILVPIQGFLIDGKVPPMEVLVNGEMVPNDFFVTVFLRELMTPIQSVLNSMDFTYGVNNCYLMPLASFILVAIYGVIAHNKEEEVGIIHD